MITTAIKIFPANKQYGIFLSEHLLILIDISINSIIQIMKIAIIYADHLNDFEEVHIMKSISKVINISICMHANTPK